MSRKKLQLKDFKTKNLTISNDQLKTTKGAYRYVSSGLGSFGQLSWSEINIRSSRLQNLFIDKDASDSASYQNATLSSRKMF